jgi:hypothetical protein
VLIVWVELDRAGSRKGEDDGDGDGLTTTWMVVDGLMDVTTKDG